MIGHEQVIYARSRGVEMPGVFLDDSNLPPVRRPWLDPEYAMLNGGPPTVYLGDDDPETVDLEFLRGLRVHLISFDLDRWATLYGRLQALPVAHLIASYGGEFNEWRPG